MDPLLIAFILVFGLLLVGAVTGIILSVRRSAERTRMLRQLAPSLDLTAVQPEELVRGQRPGEAAVWDAAGAAFGLLALNRGQVSNLFHGQRDGRDIWFFDFAYSRTPGHSDSMRATVVSLAVHTRLPQFRLCPEGKMDRLISTLGGQDIDFPTNPAFSRLYSLKADDEAAVRALFSAAVLDDFARRSAGCVASVGDRLVFHSVPATDGRMPVKDIASLLSHAVAVAGHLRA